MLPPASVCRTPRDFCSADVYVNLPATEEMRPSTRALEANRLFVNDAKDATSVSRLSA